MSRRIFIAVDIKKSIKDSIYSLSSDILSHFSQVRVIAPENLHITLRFLGNVDEERISGIQEAINDAVSGYKSFRYSLENRIDAFPGIRKARVVFIGIKEGKSNFNTIFDFLEERLAEAGIERENRSFHPHITIARIKKPFDIEEAGSKIFSVSSEELTADSVALYESVLSKSGARYINIKRFGLK